MINPLLILFLNSPLRPAPHLQQTRKKILVTVISQCPSPPPVTNSRKAWPWGPGMFLLTPPPLATMTAQVEAGGLAAGTRPSSPAGLQTSLDSVPAPQASTREAEEPVEWKPVEAAGPGWGGCPPEGKRPCAIDLQDGRDDRRLGNYSPIGLPSSPGAHESDRQRFGPHFKD